MKKTPGDNIILHKCTTNHNPMQYCSWDMVHDWCDCYFSFWAIFYPFILPNSPKNQNFKKMKKKTFGDIIILPEYTKNHDHMTVVIIFHFGPLFALFPSKQPKKSKFTKVKKNTPGDMIILHKCTMYQKSSWSYAILFLRYGTLKM